VTPRHIAVTGASGGIGAALASEYASTARRLSLTGRDPGRLDAAARACHDAGAGVSCERIDITDAEAVRSWIERIDEELPIDLLIACAGISGGTSVRGTPESPRDAVAILATNVAGTLNTLRPVAERMLARRTGHLALISSLAAFAPIPTAPTYSASKRMVAALGHALAPALRAHGVHLTVIYPGFVRTAMTERLVGIKPLCLSAPAAARRIRLGIEQGRERIVFPVSLGLWMRLLGVLPAPLSRALLAPFAYRFPEN